MKFRMLALAATVWLTACGGDNPVQPEPECHAFSLDLGADTAVALGSTLRLTPDVLQNCPVELAWTYDSTMFSLQNGVFTPRAGGRTRLIARAGGVVDSTYISIVPAGTLVAVGSEWHGEIMGGLHVMNTDLTVRRDITEALPQLVLRADPSWHPGGSLLVFHNAPEHVGARRRLFVTDLQGSVRQLIPAPTLLEEHSPAISRDGQWVYFVGVTAVSSPYSSIYRVRLDGTGLERITPLEPHLEEYPDPSPDGTRLVFSARRPDIITPVLHVMNLQSGEIASLQVDGAGPRWSPDGRQILYEAYGDLYVINPDGTGKRRINQPTDDNYHFRVDWSADGKWVAAATEVGKLQFVEVATGTVVPLPSGIRYLRPAWKR